MTVLSYPVLIRRSDAKTITKIWIPDLNIKIQNQNEIQAAEAKGLSSYIQEKATDFIKNCATQNILINQPTHLATLKQKITSGKDDIWTQTEVSQQYKKGFFARLLPFVGGASAVISNVAGTIASIISMELALSTVSDKDATRGISITQAALNSLMGLIMYFYANSGEGLEILGTKIDNHKMKNAPDNKLTIKKHKDCCTSTKIILTQTALGTLVVGNLVSNTISGYKGLQIQGEQAKQQGSIVPAELYDTCVWVIIILGGVSSLTFISGFVMKLAKDLEERIIASANRPEAQPLLNDDDLAGSQEEGIEFQQLGSPSDPEPSSPEFRV